MITSTPIAASSPPTFDVLTSSASRGDGPLRAGAEPRRAGAVRDTERPPGSAFPPEFAAARTELAKKLVLQAIFHFPPPLQTLPGGANMGVGALRKC